MSKILLLIFLLIPNIVAAQYQSSPRDPSLCSSELPFGSPISKTRPSLIICRKAYILQYDNLSKIPIWVAYTLSPPETIGCEKRLNAFSADFYIPVGYRSEIDDYRNSGYDIGHIANNADMSWDYEVNRESFILSNMTPQLPGFNRGIWRTLEGRTRAWAYYRNHPLVIYSGPIYNRNNKTIGNNRVIVPHAFYKIIVDIITNEVMVFRFNHESSDRDLSTFLTQLSSIQKETGILFPLPKNMILSRTIWETAIKNISNVKRSSCMIE
jgi:endonuclease G